MSVRITFETSLAGYVKGLKTDIKSFLKLRGIGCVITTEYRPDGERRLTYLVIEGESAKLFAVKEALDKNLREKYPGIEIAEWIERESQAPLLRQAAIIPNPTCNGANTLLSYVKDAAVAYSAVQSAVSGLSKGISVTYKGVTAVVDVALNVTWVDFVDLLKKDKDLAIEKDKEIDRVYFIAGEKKKFVRSIHLLNEGVDYYVEETVDKKKIVVDLEGFYEKLKRDQDLDEEDIQIIKTAFATQKIKFKQLIGTGELAVTDTDLKEYGVKQGGLRKAILSVIKNLKN
jgi:hypothetical protein